MVMVQLPDGKRVQFPDGMDKQAIQQSIDNYLAETQAPKATALPSRPQSAWRTALDQGLGGLTANFGDEAANLIGAGIAAPFVDESFSELAGMAQEQSKARLAAGQEQNPMTAAVSNIAGSLPTLGATATTSGAKALGQLANRFGLMGKAGLGFTAGETAQRVYEAGEAELGAKTDALLRPSISVGGAVGGAFPVAGAALGKLGQAFTPRIESTRQTVAEMAKKYNIQLGLDDLTDSKFYQHLIQKGGSLPFSKSAELKGKQMEQWSSAIGKTMGLDDVKALTPDVIDTAYKSLSKQFDDLTKGKTFELTPETLESFNLLNFKKKDGIYGTKADKIFNNYIKDVSNAFKSGDVEKFGMARGVNASKEGMTITGDAISKLRSKFNGIARETKNKNVKKMAKDFENAIIDMIGGDAKSKLPDLKYKYKNYLTVSSLSTKNMVDGKISPAQLATATKNFFGNQNLARGKAGDLGELAIIGQAMKQKVPDSGTAIANYIIGVLTGGTAMVAPQTIPLAALGTLGNRVLQNRNMNPNVIQKAMLPYTPRNLPVLGAGLLSGATTTNLE